MSPLSSRRLTWDNELGAKCDLPEEGKTPELLQAFLDEVLLALGGEAWRAMTARAKSLLFLPSGISSGFQGFVWCVRYRRPRRRSNVFAILGPIGATVGLLSFLDIVRRNR